MTKIMKRGRGWPIIKKTDCNGPAFVGTKAKDYALRGVFAETKNKIL